MGVVSDSDLPSQWLTYYVTMYEMDGIAYLFGHSPTQVSVVWLSINMTSIASKYLYQVQYNVMENHFELLFHLFYGL